MYSSEKTTAKWLVRAFITIVAIILVLGVITYFVCPAFTKSNSSILRISQAVDLATTDPALAQTVEDTNILEQIYEGLTIYDPKTASPIPGCAKSWKISKDLKTYTFLIREDAKWSDGTKLTAGDFVRGWKRIISKSVGSPWAHMLFNIKGAKKYYEGELKDFSKVGIRAKNLKTLIVELEKPQAYFLSWLSHACMSPYKEKSLAGDRDIKRLGIVISNGPYILTGRKPKEKVVLNKNKFYWDSSNVKMDEIHFIPVDDENTSLRMYDAGLLEIHGAGMPPGKVENLLKRKDMNVGNYLGTYFYRFNTMKKPFNSKLVRQAFNLAIDKKTITSKILKGGQIPAYNLVPEGIHWYEPAKGEEFDPKKARDLLDKAGYCVPDRLKVTCKAFPESEILFNTQETHSLIAQAVQSMLKNNLGINNVKLVNMDFKTTRAKEKNGDYYVARGGWIGDFMDPSTFLGILTKDNGNNRTNWSDSEYDNLLAKADTTVDEGKRADLFRNAENLLNDEAPIIPIYHYVRFYLKKSFVKGYEKNILDKHPLKFVSFSK